MPILLAILPALGLSVLAVPVPAPALEPMVRLEMRLEFGAALDAYERLARNAPGHPHAADALERAAGLAEALGERARMNRIVWMLARDHREHAGTSVWLLRLARMHERQGDLARARRILQRLVSRSGGVPRELRPEARLGLARIAAHSNEAGEARIQADKVLDAWELAPESAKGSLRELAAEAAYLRGMLAARALDWKMPADPRLDKLEPLLEDLLRNVKRTVETLQRVTGFASPQWSAAAILEAGRVFVRLGDWLMAIPPPATLSPEEAELYRQAIGDHQSSFRSRACEYFDRAASHLAENHQGSRWAREAYEARSESGCHGFYPWRRMKRRSLLASLPAPEAERELQRARKALENDPGDPAALEAAARSFLGLEKPELAAYLLEQFVPASDRSRTLLARAYAKSGRDDEAHRLASDPGREREEFPGAKRLLVELGFAFGDLRGCFPKLKAMAKAEPMQATYALSSGVAHFGLGRIEQARTQFERVLMLDPTFFEARFNLELLAEWEAR